MVTWLAEHELLIGWIGIVSVIIFLLGLIAVPWLVILIPPDYFLHRRRLIDRFVPHHPLIRALFLIFKNLLGLILLLSGLAMLVLPGPGIVAIVLGLILLDFPGKFALEQRLVRYHLIINLLNKIRRRANYPPLEIPPSQDHLH